MRGDESLDRPHSDPSKRTARVLQILDGALGADGEGDPLALLARLRDGAGAPVALLLRGDAIRYLEHDGAALRAAVAALFYVAEEAAVRGLPPAQLQAGEPIALEAVPQLIGRFAQVWHF
jgi:hypothetical protein